MMHKKRGLRMMIVSMISSSPKNGVELMDEIENMTHGWWRPSPGSIYPVLEQLTSDGMIRKKDDGRYELTDKAHDELEWSFGPTFRKARSMDDMVDEVSGFVSYFEDLNKTDRNKTAPYINKIRELADRLTTIAKQKKED
jgi:DNA-binding PadR family transcriptional regulator